MRYINIVTAVVLFFIAASSQAADCAWEVDFSGLNISTSGSFTYSCVTEDGDNVASKTVTAPAIGSTQCSISIDLDYKNAGSCLSPNVVYDDPNFSSVTVVNNQSTRSDCQVNSIAGGSGYVVYNVSCSDFDFNTYVVQTSGGYGSCSVAISGTGYTVSGSCSDYTVSKN